MTETCEPTKESPLNPKRLVNDAAVREMEKYPEGSAQRDAAVKDAKLLGVFKEPPAPRSAKGNLRRP